LYKGEEHYFGEIGDSKQIELSEIGQFANQCWSEIPLHFPFVILDAFVIMPNHVHGIVMIEKPYSGNCNQTIVNQNGGKFKNVETQNFASLHSSYPSLPSSYPSLPSSDPIKKSKNQFGPQSQNLGSIIRGYKTGVKKFTTMNNIDFAWHPRFHDHIIRSKESFNRIRNYIINNPSNWGRDEFYS
jgi:REP element-mobilizing transposase RayT